MKIKVKKGSHCLFSAGSIDGVMKCGAEWFCGNDIKLERINDTWHALYRDKNKNIVYVKYQSLRFKGYLPYDVEIKESKTC